MFSLTNVIVALTLAVGPVLATKGDMTFYPPGLGACGQTNTPADAVVALSKNQLNGKCGKTIKISREGKTATALVVDMCPGCNDNSIDVSPVVFNALADPAQGRVTVDWNFI